ncbi:hypothetical protein OIV83_000379 [Microbotryomycetes sp. JL201]|nr:hypothetical protein OIV83_000379 [Microbotryomycetes sp. JL201]
MGSFADIFKILINDVVVSQSNGWMSKQNAWVASKDNCEVGNVVRVRVIEKGGDMVLSDGTEVIAPSEKSHKLNQEDTIEYIPTSTGYSKDKDKQTNSKEATTKEGHVDTVIVTETVTEQQTMAGGSIADPGTTAAVGLNADPVASPSPTDKPAMPADTSSDSLAAEGTDMMVGTGMTSASNSAPRSGASSLGMGGGGEATDASGEGQSSSTDMSPALKWGLIVGGAILLLIVIGLIVWFSMQVRK